MGFSSLPSKRLIRVFIASPGDVAEERRAFKETVDELNSGFGRGADVEFVPLGWEDALAQVGRRSQSVINQDVDVCNAFVLVMWRRWGQEAPDAAPYTSYTEEEFYRALTRFKQTGSPELFVFFKHIDPGQMADPGPQLTKVLAFRKKLEATREVLYREFKTVAEFKREIDTHLVAYARGALASPDGAQNAPLVVPAPIIEQVQTLKDELQRLMEEAQKARAEAKDALARAEAAKNMAEVTAARRSVELAEAAAKAALEGKVEEARQDFAKALDGTTNLHVLRLGIHFFRRVGELDEAERLARRRLAISGPDAETLETAAAYSNLALIYDQRGDLDLAEEKLKKALALEEKLGLPEGLAIDYGNLGVIYNERGKLEQAEAMLKKALAIDEELGRAEGLARHYSHLGVNYEMRDRLDEAEAVLEKSLKINQNIGWPEGVARVHGTLGRVYRKRGNLDKAEELYRQALGEAQRVAEKETIARQWCNLGELAQQRGRREEAREYWTRAATLFGQMEMSKAQAACVNALALLDGHEASHQGGGSLTSNHV